MNNATKIQSPKMVRHTIHASFDAGTPFTVPVRQQRNPFWQAAGRRLRRPVNSVRILAATTLCLGLLAAKPAARAALAGSSTDLAVLVVTAQTNDYSLETIREALDFLGTPYHVHVAVDTPGSLTPDRLRDGTRGFYSGIILTTAGLGYSPDNGTTWANALTAAEWAALDQYEADFGVRRLNWYGYPTPELGFNYPTASVDTTATAIQGQWTAEGASRFVYVNTANRYPVQYVWAFLATPLDAGTKVWMTDGKGNALIASKTLPDGREIATRTFDSGPWLINASVLYHGLINWVTKGLFLGQRHTYLTAQIDDVFLADDIYTGGEYRQNSNDWHATITWQQKFRQRSSGANFRFDMAFNGLGTVPGQYKNDTLTPYAKATQAQFKWISHTYTHPYLTSFTYQEALPEILNNNQTAVQLGLTTYSIKSMVTPNITGLENPQFLNAAYDSGIRYLVTDTSIPAHRPASPNVGIPNWFVPGILMIPRHANNLFYNVSTPAQWQAEYNFLYAGYWGRNLTYAEIIADQSDLLLRPLLKGDVSPQMFHQPNLRAYNSKGQTLLCDLLNKVADKYEYYYKFPFLSPTQDRLGETCQARMDYNASGIRATRNGDGSLTFTVSQAAVIPVTGMKSPGAEFYAGQWISMIPMTAGQSLTFAPDGQGGFVPANTPVNNGPTAVNGSVTTVENTAVALTLAGTDPENNPLTFAVSSNPALGTLSGTVPNLTYTPDPGMSGTDGFQFTVSDGQFTSTGSVAITITARPNTAPAPVNTSATTPAGTAVAVGLQATDAESDPLTFTVSSAPTLGVLSGTAPDLTYTPNPGVSGADSFQFTVSDGRLTAVGTVSVTITAAPVNPGVVIALDGNLNDWAGVASVGAGLDVPNTAGNQIDLQELKLHHDAANLYLALRNESAVVLNWGYTFYFDTDRNPGTGFAMWTAGADYMIQGATLYRYTGTGSDWSWAFVQVVTTSVNGNVAELSLPRSALGNPASMNYLFYGENAAFGGANAEIIPASATTGGVGHLRHDFEEIAPTGGLVVDGNLADWTGAPLATDGDDVTGAGNPIDLRELRFTNDAGKFYLAYVNESPITLNWGYTLYLDTDSNGATGFANWAVGAEYMIQGTGIYRYSGTGADWNWTWVGSLDAVVNGTVMEASFAKSLLGATTGIRLAFHGENAAFGGNVTDVVPQNAQGAASGEQFLGYTVK